MKSLPLALLAFAMLAPCNAGAADSPGADALARKAEACIRDHAVEVSRFSPSLADAASFLVEDICAQQIGAYTTYRQSEATLALYTGDAYSQALADEDVAPSRHRSSDVRQQLAKAQAEAKATTIDPETGELRPPPGASVNGSITIMMASAIGTNRDARFRAVAGEAVLAAKAAKP